MTYAEFLKQQGASDADIQVLDTPIARRAYDAQQTAIATANTEREKAEKVATDTRDWFDNVQTPEWNGLNAEVIKAKAEAARFKTALRTAADRGLLNISKDLGLDDEGTPTTGTPTTGTPPGFDASKFVTMDQVKQIANQEGAAIALAQDIAAEHSILFPSQRLNFTQLREEAVAARKPVMQHWMDKFKVAEARTAKETSERNAHDAKLREEGAKAEREKFASQYGANPDLRTPMPSTSPFTIRKTGDDMRANQPWSHGEHQLSDDRVKRALERQANREAGRSVN